MSVQGRFIAALASPPGLAHLPMARRCSLAAPAQRGRCFARPWAVLRAASRAAAAVEGLTLQSFEALIAEQKTEGVLIDFCTDWRV
jgi:hypothetical protein